MGYALGKRHSPRRGGLSAGAPVARRPAWTGPAVVWRPVLLQTGHPYEVQDQGASRRLHLSASELWVMTSPRERAGGRGNAASALPICQPSGDACKVPGGCLKE